MRLHSAAVHPCEACSPAPLRAARRPRPARRPPAACGGAWPRAPYKTATHSCTTPALADRRVPRSGPPSCPSAPTGLVKPTWTPHPSPPRPTLVTKGGIRSPPHPARPSQSQGGVACGRRGHGAAAEQAGSDARPAAAAGPQGGSCACSGAGRSRPAALRWSRQGASTWDLRVILVHK
jgi:hypothetical protein